jgi:hypothetical protein
LEDLKLAISKDKWLHDYKMNLTGKKLLISFVAFIGAQLVFGIIIGLLKSRFDLNINSLMLNIIMNGIMILLIPIVYSFRGFSADFLKRGSFSSENIQTGIFYGLVCLLVNLIVGTILVYLYAFLGVEPAEQQALQMISNLGSSDVLLIIFGIVIAAPVAEEFFFRGVIQRTFAINISMRNAVIINSLIFALIHQDWYQFPQIFLLSVVLSIAYNKTGNIVTPIIAHIISNSLFLLAFFI